MVESAVSSTDAAGTLQTAMPGDARHAGRSLGWSWASPTRPGQEIKAGYLPLSWTTGHWPFLERVSARTLVPKQRLPRPSAQGRTGWGAGRAWETEQEELESPSDSRRRQRPGPAGLQRGGPPSTPRRSWKKDAAPAGQIKRQRGPAPSAGTNPRDTPARRALSVPSDSGADAAGDRRWRGGRWGDRAQRAQAG